MSKNSNRKKIHEEIRNTNIPNEMKNINLLIKEFQKTPSKANLKRLIFRYNIIKLLKDKHRDTKSSRRKLTHHVQGRPVEREIQRAEIPRCSITRITMLSVEGEMKTENSLLADLSYTVKEILQAERK